MPTSYSWYTSKTTEESPDNIHQILAYGSLSEIKSLKKALGEEVVKKKFMSYPKKIYTASSLNFITKFILHISTSIDEQKYLKSTPRYY